MKKITYTENAQKNFFSHINSWREELAKSVMGGQDFVKKEEHDYALKKQGEEYKEQLKKIKSSVRNLNSVIDLRNMENKIINEQYRKLTEQYSYLMELKLSKVIALICTILVAILSILFLSLYLTREKWYFARLADLDQLVNQDQSVNPNQPVCYPQIRKNSAKGELYTSFQDKKGKSASDRDCPTSQLEKEVCKDVEKKDHS